MNPLIQNLLYMININMYGASCVLHAERLSIILSLFLPVLFDYGPVCAVMCNLSSSLPYGKRQTRFVPSLLDVSLKLCS